MRGFWKFGKYTCYWVWNFVWACMHAFAAMWDCASLNTVALQTLKDLFPWILNVGYFPTQLTMHIGDHFNVPTLDDCGHLGSASFHIVINQIWIEGVHWQSHVFVLWDMIVKQRSSDWHYFRMALKDWKYMYLVLYCQRSFVILLAKLDA